MREVKVVAAADTKYRPIPYYTRASAEARVHLRHHRGEGSSHCSRCAPGWGVVEHCSRGRDTKCAECQPGSYSPHHGTQPCWLCSRCGPGLYEAKACTTSSDTICDSCLRQAPDNPDFRRKCQQQHHREAAIYLAPEDARNTGEQSELVNVDLTREIDAERERERLLWQDAQAQLKEQQQMRARANSLQQQQHEHEQQRRQQLD
ncbi:hypothetical protein TKK_0014253 [Trichogramma kaykai]